MEEAPLSQRARGVWSHRGYTLQYGADFVSTLGTAVSALALQFLLIDTLHADQAAIGWARAAQWLPYLLFGLAAGVVAERHRRRPMLVACDLGQAMCAGTIGALALTGHLTLPVLMALLFVAGTLTCLGIAASQSYVPRLLPETLLPRGFANREMINAVSSSTGPLGAGALVRLLSAPVAMLVDAVSFLVSAVLIGSIRDEEPRQERGAERNVLREVADGMRWVYGHAALRPYALWLHGWFFFRGMGRTILVYFAAVELGLGPVALGLLLSLEGVVSLLVVGWAPRLARRFGTGRTVVATEVITAPAAAALIASAPHGAVGIAMLTAAMVLSGASSLTGALTMAHRTVVTPDPLRARMNATIRTFNWGGMALAAPLGGLLAAGAGNRVALWASAAGLTLATAYLALSPYRREVLPGERDVPQHG